MSGAYRSHANRAAILLTILSVGGLAVLVGMGMYNGADYNRARDELTGDLADVEKVETALRPWLDRWGYGRSALPEPAS